MADQTVARLPNFKDVKRTIQRQSIAHDLPKISHDKTFPTVPTSLITIIRGETFLQYGSGPVEHRILIFASSERLNILSGFIRFDERTSKEFSFNLSKSRVSIDVVADSFPHFLSGCLVVGTNQPWNSSIRHLFSLIVKMSPVSSFAIDEEQPSRSVCFARWCIFVSSLDFVRWLCWISVVRPALLCHVLLDTLPWLRKATDCSTSLNNRRSIYFRSSGVT